MISNNRIKYLKSLQQKKYRDLENKFLVEGKKIVEEAFSLHRDLIDVVYCTNEYAETHPNELKETTEIVSYEEIKKISSLTKPQQIIAVLNKPKQTDFRFESQHDLILVLDAIRDPGNLGTILRMADWFGVQHIICSTDCVDCYNPKVVQATMGAILRSKLYFTDLPEFLISARSNNFEIYGATLDGENIYKSNLIKKSVIVVGNESDGISKEICNLLSQELLIPNFSPHQEKTESLNVAIATSVILSEFRRS